ncbi:MAG: hypothetical protein CSA54_05775 [Gammaproteobacteria bacterium]|nr:MAG: hypothetical protein CSA54_05775 [Gammaproteobacteria bacterium]
MAAVIKGWRRVWSHRVEAPNRDFGCTSLNVERHPEATISGVLVRMPMSELPTLDLRESGYVRIPLDRDDLVLAPEHASLTRDCRELFLYSSLPKNTSPANRQRPILQSYVDCVMAGFERVFGDEGLAAFIDSTRGWQWPRVNDRDDPYYPRAVPLDGESHRHFDELLHAAARHAA